MIDIEHRRANCAPRQARLVNGSIDQEEANSDDELQHIEEEPRVSTGVANLWEHERDSMSGMRH